MGFINFQDRQGNHKIFDTEFISDHNELEGNLEGLLVGDTVILALDLDSDVVAIYKNQHIPGVKICERLKVNEIDPIRHEAEITFTIVRREHYVSREWAGAYKTGFRVSSTSITIEAATEGAEELFHTLQLKYNDEKRFA